MGDKESTITNLVREKLFADDDEDMTACVRKHSDMLDSMRSALVFEKQSERYFTEYSAVQPLFMLFAQSLVRAVLPRCNVSPAQRCPLSCPVNLHGESGEEVQSTPSGFADVIICPEQDDPDSCSPEPLSKS